MTEADNDYAQKLSNRLKDFSDELEDDRQKELLAGILTVAHGLKDSSTELEADQKKALAGLHAVGPGLKDGANGNGTSGLVSGFKDAFDPLPAEKIQTIMKYKNEDNSPSGMIVYSEPVVAHDEPKVPDPEQPES